MSEQDETPVQDQGRGNSAFYACSVSFKTIALCILILLFQVLQHEKLDEHLALAQSSPDFPDWWECGKHDKDLLLGVSKYVA